MQCQESNKMQEHACTNKEQCWEPCGDLGKNAQHVKVIPRDEEHKILKGR